MATTDFKLDDPGTLTRPGPIGRAVRLGFAAACASALFDLWQVGPDLLIVAGTLRITSLVLFAVALYLINYVVNIGFSRSWKKWPAIVSGGIFLAVAAVNYSSGGSIVNPLLSNTVWMWEAYIFVHLGTAFLLAGMIGTPGCEMRGFHDLFTRVTGIATQEHICPVGPLGPIDRWEAGRRKSG